METGVELKFLDHDKFQIKTLTNQARFYVDKKKEDYVPQGPNPLELFLASLSSCVGVYALRYLTNHKVQFGKLEIFSSADFSDSSPARLLNIKVRLHTDAALGEAKEVFLRFIKNCPIHNTILHSKEIDIVLD